MDPELRDLLTRQRGSMKKRIRELQRTKKALLLEKPATKSLSLRIWHARLRVLNAEIKEQSLRLEAVENEYGAETAAEREAIGKKEGLRRKSSRNNISRHRKELEKLLTRQEAVQALPALAAMTQTLEFEVTEEDAARQRNIDLARQELERGEEEWREQLKRELQSAEEDWSRRQKRQKQVSESDLLF